MGLSVEGVLFICSNGSVPLNKMVAKHYIVKKRNKKKKKKKRKTLLVLFLLLFGLCYKAICFKSCLVLFCAGVFQSFKQCDYHAWGRES